MTDDPFAEITQIVREHHDTGRYGGCRFDVHPAVLDLMRSTQPAPDPFEQWTRPGAGLGLFTGIPVVVNESLPAGGWRLAQMSHDPDPPFIRHYVIVKHGTIEMRNR